MNTPWKSRFNFDTIVRCLELLSLKYYIAHFATLESFWFMDIFSSWIIANFHFYTAHSDRDPSRKINAINQKQVSKNRWIVPIQTKLRFSGLFFVCSLLLSDWQPLCLIRCTIFLCKVILSGQSIKNLWQILATNKSCLTDHDYKLQPHSV